jgi:hypothetical protein
MWGAAVILITTLPETDAGAYSTVRFPYDEDCVAIMKTIPVHRWNGRAKEWTTETSWVELLAKRFCDRGFDVAIDGELWYLPDPKAFAEPLQALFDALPARLRTPAFRALSKVLHPDTGGDTEWMKQLNKAIDKTR